ncbi:MAG: PadR family transcriptional regulator [Anaerolineaceae bacterium]|nr:PadR family transcriptional regulator [Anaerolineaceae bacterium]
MSPRKQSPFSFEYVLLGIIYQHPIHGYELFKDVSQQEGIALVWKVKQSQLYALLDKLEIEGYIQSTLIPNEARPTRKQYCLTDLGHTSFLSWVQSPVKHVRDVRQDFMARLYFARQLGKDAAALLLKRQKEVCQTWRDEIEVRLRSMGDYESFDRLVYGYRLKQMDATLYWLDECSEMMVKAWQISQLQDHK